jgi:uncharacterized membrane-anchored protein YjiN (DUF445 family)
MAARVAAMKAELLGNAAVTAWLDAMWERIRAALLKALRDPQASMNGSMGAVVAQGLGELGAALAANPQLQRHVNRFARRTLVGLASRHGDQIVRLVSETVKRWDATTVTSRIEGAVGRDLQFIRINGTLVGGLVGLAIHAAEVLL